MSQPKSLGLFKTQVKTVFLYQSSDQLKICQSVSQELEARQRICVRQPLGTCGGAMIIFNMESSRDPSLQLKMTQPKNEFKKIQEKDKKNPPTPPTPPTPNPVQPQPRPTLQAMQPSFSLQICSPVNLSTSVEPSEIQFKRLLPSK